MHETENADRRNAARIKRARAAIAQLLAFALVLSLFFSEGMLPSASAAKAGKSEKKTYCGLKEHEHTDACYTTQRTLICTEEETGHRHTEDCYTETVSFVCGLTECPEHHHTEDCFVERSVLVCTQAECPAHHHTAECMVERSVLCCGCDDPEHVHTEECYTTETVLGCGRTETDGHSHTEECYATETVLGCGKAETEGHTHTEECRCVERVLSCGKEEREGHIHGEECWKEEKVLICGKSEHKHSLECYSDRSSVEYEADWRASVSSAMITGRWDKDLVAVARTQTGYRPNIRNYIVVDGVVRYYTRYGDWIDDAEAVVYGDWCASFAAFCVHYARIPNVPYSSNCASWVRKLMDVGMYYEFGEIEPKMGDLIFFYSGREKDAQAHKAVHMGIIAEVTDHSIVTIEGNIGTVGWREYEFDNLETVLGYGRFPENSDYRSVEGSRGPVSYSGVLAEDAQIVVTPLSEEEIALYELPEGRVLFAFETSYLVDGEEKKPGTAVNVRVETGKLPEGEIRVYHIKEDDKGEIAEFWPVEDMEITDGALSYTTFSLARCVAVLVEPGGGE